MVARLRWAGAHNERSPTVTRRDGRTSSWLDDDETAGQQRGKEGQTGIEVQCRAELGIQGPPVWNWCAQEHKASENWQECQWRNLSNVDWRSTELQCWEPTGGDSDFSRLVGKPDNVALPKSSFVSTRLTIRVRKTDDGTVRRTLRSWRKTAKQPATVRWTRDRMLRSASMKIPRSRTVLDGMMSCSPILNADRGSWCTSVFELGLLYIPILAFKPCCGIFTMHHAETQIHYRL